MYISQDHRISNLEDLTGTNLEFLWLRPTVQHISTVIQNQTNCLELLTKTTNLLDNMDSFDEENLKEVFQSVCKDCGWKMKNYMKLLRNSLSEAKVSTCIYFVTS